MNQVLVMHVFECSKDCFNDVSNLNIALLIYIHFDYAVQITSVWNIFLNKIDMVLELIHVYHLNDVWMLALSNELKFTV